MTADRTASALGQPADLFDLEAELSAEERTIGDTTRRFVRDRVLPEVARWFEQAVFPAKMASELGELGVLGMHLDGYGCAGASATAYGLACLELEAGDSGLRSFASVQGSLVMYALWRYGSAAHKDRWLPPLAAGQAIGCFALTEPDHGSDPASMRTAARRDGPDWVLDGTKTWITNGSIADVAIVWARTERGIRGFVVPTDTPGFHAWEIPRKLSLRASVTSELALDGCRLPADAVLPGATGLKAALSCLNEGRYGIVWGAVGAARSCFQTALSHAQSRSQFGRPIAGFQLTQDKLVDMLVAVNQGMLLAYRVGRMKDAGTATRHHISVGKRTNVRAALAVARTARSILGASGISLDYPVIRHMTNLESVATYEGTDEIHTLALGEALTGLSAFR